jgi:hypothetical protein
MGRRLERLREQTDSVRVVSHAKGYRSPVPGVPKAVWSMSLWRDESPSWV